MGKMKISYVTTYDALNVHNWSGLGYYIAKALERQNNELNYIGKLNIPTQLPLRIKSVLYKKFKKKTFDFNRNPIVAKEFAKQILSSLKTDTNIIFSPGSMPISLLDINKPKVFYTDTTFAGMIGFYEGYSNLCKETIEHGNYLEQKALESSKLAIYSSDWAAQTAIDNYNVNPTKIKVVPFGANIECNRDLNAIKQIVSARSSKECHLLFLGVEWKRKGGEMAVRVASRLNKMGIKTILHIAGIKSIPIANIPSFVVDHGFISKATQEGKEKINTLISKSHFLILPTQAEAYGIVFCESNSFGVPCISTNVGGIPTIIKENINGMTFSAEDGENLYADYIKSVFTDHERYKELAYSSFNEYEKRLNWDVAGKTITSLLKEL